MWSNCTNQRPLQHGGTVPTAFGLGRNGCWPSRGFQLSWALPFIFLLCCPLNDCRRAAPHLHLLVLLLLLISSNAYPNPGPIFPCSVYAGNVTWRGNSVQCCTYFKWVHLRCSQLFLSKFRTPVNSHCWRCPPFRVPTRNTVTSSSDSSDLYTSTVQSGPFC